MSPQKEIVDYMLFRTKDIVYVMRIVVNCWYVIKIVFFQRLSVYGIAY